MAEQVPNQCRIPIRHRLAWENFDWNPVIDFGPNQH